jgi:hypothetical protein
MPGSHLTDLNRAWFDEMVDAYRTVWASVPYLVDAGMEDMKSPYMLLEIGGSRYLLLERRNDDGEWSPLFYHADLLVGAPSVPMIFRAMSCIGEFADEIRCETLIGYGVCTRDGYERGLFEECLSATFYGYRDLIAPNALG